MPRVNDCAIRAAAAATGLSYGSVKAAFGPMEKGGLTKDQCEWLLGELGEWSRCRPRMKSLGEFAADRLGRYFCVIDRIWDGYHAVTLIDGEFPPEYSNHMLV